MRSRSIAFCLLASLLLLAAPLRAKDDWMPITAADLTFKDPNGSSAVILYLQDDRDDSPAAGNGSTETVYYREKILTEEGKKHADIEIPYLKDYSKIEDIKARVVQADGAITIFDGKIYDKTIVKSKTLKILVRTFTIPNVQVGSIVEYRYKVHWTISALLDTAWRIQQELPLKHARFTLKPYTGLTTEPVHVAWNTVSMPAGYKPQYDHGQYWLEVNDIPAMPDEKQLAEQAKIHPDDSVSVCARLMGFGLAFEVARNVTRQSPGEHCFRPTRRGVYLLSLLDAASKAN